MKQECMYIYKFVEVEKVKFTEGLEDFQVCQRVNRETLYKIYTR